MTEIKKELPGKIPSRRMSREIGQPGIITADRLIKDAKKSELIAPKSWDTFDVMCLDDAVATSINYTNIIVALALYNGEFVGETPKAKKAAEFLNYAKETIRYTNWWSVVWNMCTDLKYGFSLANVVTEVRDTSEFGRVRAWKNISPRSPKSIYSWLWDKDHRYLKGVVQKPMLVANRDPSLGEYVDGIKESGLAKYRKSKYPIMREEQLLRTAFDSTLNNPQGNPRLASCFDAWYEKKLIEKLEIAGTTKDLAGVLLLYFPSELAEQANQDPESDAAKELQALYKNAEDLHQGKSSYIALYSDTDERGNRDYDIQLKGIDGGGKNYVTSDIIDQKRKSIYNTFGTGFLLLGQGETGSYALSSTQKSAHSFQAEANITQKAEVLKLLGQRLLEVNGVEYSYKDRVTFVPADPDQLSLDELGKFIQRAKSVQGLTPEMMKHAVQLSGFSPDGIDDLDFTDKGASRSGESQGSSGTGNTQDGGRASTVNANNGGVQKDLRACDKTDRLFDENDICINEEDLDKDGYYK